ncbi:hypothetical protein NM208_g5307 [Fusarium decemcellulare]|uniref:Uncharacterized protein n=1 Tax=Fusarium decemcellulare TaxID=57161 RepID=A0ACC1SHK6_9HYPO|nr:hypothetical protein NM208_g5307 [Fusarium decemcellulare]
METKSAKKSRGSYSYGGCATCRRRHVKCDKVRPVCLTCKAIGVTCEGFQDAGLRWVTTAGASGSKVSKSLTRTPRRPFYPEQSQVSNSKEVESTLSDKTLDESLLSLEARSKDFATPSDEGVTIGPFGVFSVENITPEPPTRSLDVDIEPPQGIISKTGTRDASVPERNTQSYAIESGSALELLPSTDNLLDWTDLFDLDSGFSWRPSEAVNDINMPDFSLPTSSPVAAVDILQFQASIETQDTPESSLPRPVFSEVIAVEDAQLLLKHFNDCMIAHIWSLPLAQKCSLDIHIDAAVATLARLTFLTTRTVSHASLSHLYSVLSLSAMHLAHIKGQSNVQHWHNLAGSMSKKAKNNFRYSLEHEISPKAAKYKDLVLAISSILTFAILYDDQDDARAYMLDSERLLRTCGLAKRRISRKASYLHHTYTWVRIVGESTYVLHKFDNPNVKSKQGQGSPDAAAGLFPEGPYTNYRQAHPNPRLDDFLGLEPFQLDVDMDKVDSRDIESPLSHIHLEDNQGKSDSALRFLYGVSETWLSLVSQTTRLANFMARLAQSKEKFDSSSLDSLESHKKRLENLVWALAQSTPPPQMEETSKYTPRDHLVRALNYTLVIFFYRRIRDVNPSILQQHIDNVIEALREFDAACERDGIDGPGSPWPAFLAGCEAMHTSQRKYFSGWLQNSFEKTGFTRFRTIISCMHEVWRRQGEGMGIGQPNGTWVQVCQEQDLYVMLC